MKSNSGSHVTMTFLKATKLFSRWINSDKSSSSSRDSHAFSSATAQKSLACDARLFHQHPERKKLVVTPSALEEITLVLTQEGLRSGFDPVQYNTSKNFAGNAQEGNASTVVALATTFLLVKRENEVVQSF